MTDTIESICYEYAEDSLFSKDSSACGAPLKIIVYIQYKYIAELSNSYLIMDMKFPIKKIQVSILESFTSH